MHASDKSTKPSVADSTYRWHKAGYLPIAFAAAGCAAAIAIAFEAKELSNQRLELDTSRPTREKIMVGSSLMHHALVYVHREPGSIEIKEKDHQRLLSLAQHEIEKVQKDKADVMQKIEKFVKEEAKGDFDRAAEKRIEAVRDQIENEPKSLAILNDRFTRGQIKLVSLIDQRAKLKTALPQMTIDETRLRGAGKRLEDEIRSATERRDAVASEISRAEDQLHQLQQDRVSEDQLHQLQQDRVRQTIGGDKYKQLADDLRKQSEHSRKNVAELERKQATFVLPTRVSADVPLVDQSNQEERREAELRSQDADLDARRTVLEQNIKVLQQQKEELVKTNKSFRDQLDAAAANLSSIMEQVKTLEPDRREAVALQAQLEELNRQIDERRKMIDHLAKPAPRSRHVRPVPLGATDQAPRGIR